MIAGTRATTTSSAATAASAVASAEEFRDAGVPFVVLDFTHDSSIRGRGPRPLCSREPGRRTRTSRASGSTRAKASSRRATPTSTTSTSSSRLAQRGRTCSSSPGRRPRTRPARCGAPAPTGSSSRTPSAGQEMAKLVLRPQVAAFLDIVTSRGGPDLRMEEIEMSPTCDNAGKTIRELRVRRETGALIVALRKPDGDLRHDPERRRGARCRRRADRRRHGGGAAGRSRSCSSRAKPLPARTLARLEAALSGLAGAGSSSSGRRTPSTATTPRTSRCELAPAQGRPPRELAQELAERAACAAGGRARGGRRPRFRQPLARTGMVRRRAGRHPRGRAGVRRGAGGPARARPGRDGVGEPDRPDRRLRRPQRRLRRLGRAPAGVRRPRGRARVLLQRRRAADGALPGIDRRCPRGPRAARGRLPGRLHR